MLKKPWLSFALSVAVVVVALLGAVQWGAQRRFVVRGWTGTFPDPVMDTPGAGETEVPRLCVNAPLVSYGAGELEAALTHIEAGGFAWIRVLITPADLTTGALDEAIAAAEARGLRLWAVLDAPSDDPPPDPETFAGFAAAVADRYGDLLTYYQIWHNPNLGASWGGVADPFGYTALLAEAAAAIRATDADARIVLGSLAPTVETGDTNYAEDLFLEMLYAAGAGPAFDVVAVQPYGFDTGPDDRRVRRDVLNFSRPLLVRQVMDKHGDEAKAIWASGFGWNSKPEAWPGPPSIWGEVDTTTQAAYTVAALERIEREWSWLGVACLNSYQPRPEAERDAANSVPNAEEHWGFALVGPDEEVRPVYEAVQAWAAVKAAAPAAVPGVYRADTELADYEGSWTLGPQGADIGQDGEQRARFVFEGTGVALTVRRGPYRAFLFVMVDGQPAPALPRDRQGRAYVVLYDPLAATVTVPLAEGLAPGVHTVELVAERGWGQWALADWRVAHAPPGRAAFRRGLLGFGGLAVAGLVGAVLAGRRMAWGELLPAARAWWGRLSEGVRVATSLLVSAVAVFAAWQTIMSESLFRWLGDRGGWMALFLAVGLFRFSPWFLLTLVAGAVMVVIVVLQPSLGLMVTVMTAPFYMHPLSLLGKSFALAELVLLPTLAGWILWLVGAWAQRGRRPQQKAAEGAAELRLSPAHHDVLRALAFFVGLAVLATLAAQHRHEALRELRLVVLEPVLFFLALVTLPMQRRERWRVIDGWVAGAVIIAVIGLVQYFLLDDVITAEGGIRRLRSIYGSPNNVGLQLGRVWPVLVAVVLWAGKAAPGGLGAWWADLRGSPRRVAYAFALVPVTAALLLSLSRGALVLGLPAAALTLGLLAGRTWRRVAVVTAIIGVIAVLLLVRFPQVLGPRFESMLDFRQGSESFRLALWHSTLQMVRDSPWLGVGPDNFLYAYRTRYVLPTAWEEFNLSHPHNVVLDYVARLGLGGLVALVWMQVIFWRRVVPLRRLANPADRALAVGFAASMADFLAHGLVDASYFVIDLAYIYMLSLAVVVWLSSGGAALDAPRTV